MTLASLHNVSKSFGPNQVLNGVSFDIEEGEIVALLGENGAGKSTLVNIIAGNLSPDSGTIEVEGERQSFQGPNDAIRAGIALIHQELSLIRSLSIGENVFLNNYHANALGLADFRKTNERARAILDRLGGERISTTKMAETLGAADQQTVEIAKAIVHSPKLLIMDEPTSSLTRHEAEALFDVVRNLRQDGVSIIFIGHRLEEAFAIADRVVVMRDGDLVMNQPTEDTSISETVEKMVGREIDMSPRWTLHTPDPAAEPSLKADGLHDDHLLRDVSFEVRPGEVLGLFGLVGAGRSELLELLFGDRQPSEGSITLRGDVVSLGSPTEAIRSGLALLPEGRKEQGILPQRSIIENMSQSCASRFTRFGFVRDRAMTNACETYVDRFDIKIQSLRQPIDELSGGNQQKVLLSRLLLSNPQVILLDEPTHGIDVRTKAQIYDTIAELSRQNITVVMVSSELPELLINAHRILVMTNGRIVREFDNSPDLREGEIIRYAFPDAAEAVSG